NVVSNVLPDGGEYLMSYSIGTPPVKILGIVDTGSDIIWLQCQPCHPCYNQTTPIFDPSKSTTYKTIPCTSNKCKSVRDTSCSSDGNQQSCQYRIGYGDGSRSQGDLSLDTLTLGSTNGSAVSFPKTIVGCGNSNFGVSREGSGIVGLGNGPVSLITQLGSSIEGKFSYCLTPSFSNTKSPSKLNFGKDAVVSGSGVVSTPLFLDTVFYYLTIEAFSVGNKRVEFGKSSTSEGGSGNIIIDSGTTLTLLPEDVYSDLESAVAEAVKLERVEAPTRLLSLCYQLPSSDEKLQFPVFTVHFIGGDIELNPINTFVKVTDDIICFAFAPTNQPISIFGNLAQQNLLVGYDLQKKTLSIKPTDCRKQ
ncbi:PREDICTED: LOW QUALITY PROTEIN: aspartic proteinase CDR1-like, partial [Lupinus angustifolius]|uniref:LOW QUALITY PROTEIN: aspartic proteinase CDR1-like n=1 Tax=Lupinus angustifolius TaxID=3871 RepID=UPI00092F283D